MLDAAEAKNLHNLSFVEADLTRDDGWTEAVKDCTFVLHVASPFPAARPKHEDDLIIPARQDTLRVLRAARDAGVKRVVVTSSYAAVIGGIRNTDASRIFTEKDWAKTENPKIDAYQNSKALGTAWNWLSSTQLGSWVRY